MKKNFPLSPKKFSAKLLSWFDQYGRHDLPWQKNKTPYRVWVSEIMLQQTQVSTVIAYFDRFIEAFPDVNALANATEDQVLHLWTGLGYYSRARNVLKAAQKIVSTFDGRFPSDLDGLQSLPGIGRSTAGAILSIAFEKKATILDGNVKRVLTRLYGFTKWPGEKNVTEHLWQIAETLTPAKRAADYSQAIMDLGATLCVRGKPNCGLCPFNTVCVAHAKGLEKTIPASKPRKPLPVRQTYVLMLQNPEGAVLLVKRPAQGIWAGLWSFPELDPEATPADIKQYCRDELKSPVTRFTQQKPFRHTFSHYHLDIVPILIQVKKPGIMDSSQQIWYNIRQSRLIGLPAPIKTLLTQLDP